MGKNMVQCVVHLVVQKEEKLGIANEYGNYQSAPIIHRNIKH